MTKSNLPDAVKKELIDKSIYVEGASFGRKKKDARFLVVFAVPYGPSDEVFNKADAIAAFQEFISDYDWKDRTLTVYDAYSQKVSQVVPDQL